MTMLDDDQLASLFARAGETFDVPASGAADIVARATGAAGADAPSDADAAEDETPGELEGLGRGGRAGWPPPPAGTGRWRWPPAWCWCSWWPARSAR